MKISVVVLAWFVLLTQETQPENPLAMSWWTSLKSTLLSFPDGQRCRRLPPYVWCKTRWLGLNCSGGSTGSDPPKGYSSWIPRSELVRANWIHGSSCRRIPSAPAVPYRTAPDTFECALMLLRCWCTTGPWEYTCMSHIHTRDDMSDRLVWHRIE